MSVDSAFLRQAFHFPCKCASGESHSLNKETCFGILSQKKTEEGIVSGE